MSRISDLISPCLVPFQTVPRPDGKVVYRSENFKLSERDIIDQLSYTVSSDSSNRDAEGKVFYAERYGGIGMGPHGGGARCGYDGALYQVKGIGPNPLVGFTEATGQRDGILPLQSAFHEMIWSRILQDKLPFGVVECLAIVALDSRKRAGISIGTNAKRALMIREICVRPAHFERAAYFRKKPYDPVADRSKDVLRVAAMCGKLPSALELLLDCRDIPSDNVILDGLSNLAHRQALQLAFARSHFLYHSISSSNIAMDGRWLDFMSMTPLHARSISAKPMTSSAWSRWWGQDLIMIEILTSLVFHYCKFMKLPGSMCRAWINEITDKFSRDLVSAHTKYSLCTAGVPLVLAERVCLDGDVQHWASHFHEILRNRWPKIERQGNPADVNTERSLHDFTFSAASNHPPTSLGLDDAEAIEYHSRRGKVKRLVESDALTLGISSENLMVGMTVNAIRFSAEKSDLSFSVFSKDIANVVKRFTQNSKDFMHEIENLTARMLRVGNFHLKFDPEFVVTCWDDGKVRVCYDMRDGYFAVVSGNKVDCISRGLARGYFENDNSMNPMIDFYRKFNALFVFGCDENEY